jgi:hypothetical protein
MHYLLPLKAAPGDDLGELGHYVRELAQHCPVIVVDGSDPETFARNGALFGPTVTHVRPTFDCANGKVSGVLTGFTLCTSGKVVIADDDVRYTRDDLDQLERLLDDADLVIPQNYYDPMPWPAWWDTARVLINRALPSGDFPGTLGLRLSDRLRSLGYNGDVLFENLELIRTVAADGGRTVIARGIYVRRLPPTARHFATQRIRQAYDSQAQPVRLAVELSLLPLVLVGRRKPAIWLAMIVGSTALARIGSRRAGAAARFPAAAALLAPVWVAERAVCAWAALAQRMRGGITYSGRRIKLAATSVPALRRQRERTCGCRRKTA